MIKCIKSIRVYSFGGESIIINNHIRAFIAVKRLPKLSNVADVLGNDHLIEFHLTFSVDQKFLLN
jgi:hypothetical protein